MGSASLALQPAPLSHHTCYTCHISYTPVINTYPPVTMAAKPDPYANIDFDEICEATGLAVDEIKCLKVCFHLFDTKKVEFLSADDLGEIEIGEFCQLCATFLVEDPDMETMKRELKDAFR